LYLTDTEHPFGINPVGTFNKIDSPEVSGKYLWLQGDDENRFNSSKRKKGKDWKYLTKEVTYTVNSSGFRTLEWDQIDWKNSIVLLGCSCTYGIGLSDDETISFHLERLSGRPVINLGVPGGSNSLILYNSTKILESFETPYAVATIWTPTDRFEFFSKIGRHKSGPWDGRHKAPHTSQETDVSKLWQLTYADPSHEIGLTYNQGLIGKWLWKERSKYSSISFFYSTAQILNAEKHFKIDKTARDLQHPGEVISIEVAEYLHERFK